MNVKNNDVDDNWATQRYTSVASLDVQVITHISIRLPLDGEYTVGQCMVESM